MTALRTLWHDPQWRGIVFQAVTLGLLVWFFWAIGSNTAENLKDRGIASGFGFLDTTAGFAIQQTLIPFSETSTYFDAFLVGLLNTLLVAAIGIVLATIIGIAVGLARLSRNWLISRLALAYIELLRNIPLLLFIFFLYFAVLQALPGPRQSLSVLELGFLNNRGLYLPRPVFEDSFIIVELLFVAGLILAFALARWAKLRQLRTGQQFPAFWCGLALVISLPLLGFLATGAPVTFDLPKLRGFNFNGGLAINPEFVAIVLSLSLYTAAFIAEIVRAGIQGVNYGQMEAASALGLPPNRTMRLVVLPQAARIIIPPLTSQYLNLTKNSSLAAAVAYPDLVHTFAGTVLNQTGQAVEVILMTMAVYLTISLTISFLMNIYNKRMALVER